MTLPIDTIQKMRAAGRSWRAISQSIGVGAEAIRRAVDPEWAALRREHNTTNRKRRRSTRAVIAKQHRVEPERPTPDEARRAIASVPRDTRDITARTFGDPLPGRSALDRSVRHVDADLADVHGVDVTHLVGRETP